MGGAVAKEDARRSAARFAVGEGPAFDDRVEDCYYQWFQRMVSSEDDRSAVLKSVPMV